MAVEARFGPSCWRAREPAVQAAAEQVFRRASLRTGEFANGKAAVGQATGGPRYRQAGLPTVQATGGPV
jgi:hypothetical protein